MCRLSKACGGFMRGRRAVPWLPPQQADASASVSCRVRAGAAPPAAQPPFQPAALQQAQAQAQAAQRAASVRRVPGLIRLGLTHAR